MSVFPIKFCIFLYFFFCVNFIFFGLFKLEGFGLNFLLGVSRDKWL